MASTGGTKLIIIHLSIRISLLYASTLLTSDHATPFGICPQATLTCSVNNLPGNTLLWFFDERAVISYTLLNVGDDQYPLMLSSPPELADVVSFEILEASISQNVANTNFISIMTANLSSLREAGVTNITCGNRVTRSNGYLLDFTIVLILPPPPFSSICSIVSSSESSNISIQWVTSSQNQVDIYQVEANADLPGCSREVIPGEKYSCSGLSLGTAYSFTVNATNNNCENKTSSATFTLQPQVPSTPINVEVIALYDESINLKEIIVNWNEVDNVQLSNSHDSCIFDEQIDYTLILEDGSGMLVNQRILTSSCCIHKTCSTAYCNSSFLSFQPSLTYSVTVMASNAVGHSDSVSHHGIEYSYNSLFNLSLFFESCVTTIECISTMSTTGWCSIDFGVQKLSGEIMNNSLNSPFKFSLLKSSSEYHISTQVQIDNTSFMILRNFSTGKFDPHLDVLNICLLGSGISVLVIAITVYISFIKGILGLRVSCLLILLMLLPMFFTTISLSLWIFAGVHVGNQKDTCDLKWKKTRNGLIIAGFTLSLTTLISTIIGGALKKVMFLRTKKSSTQSPQQRHEGIHVHSTVSETETRGCNSNYAVSDSGLRKEVVVYDEAMNPVNNNNNSFKLQENVAYN